MKLQTFIETCLLILFLSVLCVSDDMPFISVAGDCRYPAVASEGNSIYMAWLVAEGRATKLYFRQSTDEGITWNSARKISDGRGDCYPPAIAVDSGTIHLAWTDYGETVNGEIYYNRSLDGGDTWEKNFILVKDANGARYPLLVCKEKNVYLIWQDAENKIFFKSSRDRGRTWEGEMMLGKVGMHTCYCFPPTMSCNRNELVVVWTDFRKDKKGFNVRIFGLSAYKTNDQMVSSVVCRKSADNGHTWSKEQTLSATKVPKEMRDEIDHPIMLSDGILSYLFWLDKRNLPLGEIFYTRFDPKSVKFPITGKNLYPAQKRSPKRPSVVFDNIGNLHFTWASFFRGKSIVHYGEIDPAGNILKEKKDLTTNTGRYHGPTIARTRSGLMHVFWFDEPPQDKDEWSKIYLKTSKDNGLTWEDWEPQEKDR
jgi:hypothetical protein